MLLAAGAVVIGASAVACSSAATTTAARPSSAGAMTAMPADPATIVQQAGATTTVISTDSYGDRQAQGVFPSATVPGCSTANGGCLESVEAYTYATAQDQARAEQSRPSYDDEVTIVGDRFDLVVYGVSVDGTTLKFPVSPELIASRVHGSVL